MRSTVDEEGVQRLTEREKNAHDAFQAALEQVLSTVAGRQVLWHYMSRAGIYGSSFSSDPLAMAFREGRRDMGLGIMRDIQLTDGGGSYNLMQREAIARDGVRSKDDDGED